MSKIIIGGGEFNNISVKSIDPDAKIINNINNYSVNINNTAYTNSNECSLTDFHLTFMYDKANNKYNTFSQEELTMVNGDINVNNGIIYQKGVQFIFDYNGTIGFCKNLNGTVSGNYEYRSKLITIWGFYDKTNEAAIINSNFVDFKTNGGSNWLHLLYVIANGITFYCYAPTSTTDIRGNYIAGKIYCTAGEATYLNASNPQAHNYYILCYYYNQIQLNNKAVKYWNYVVRKDNGDDFNWEGNWCLFKLHDVEMTTKHGKTYRY